jgi:hypothetical protein
MSRAVVGALVVVALPVIIAATQLHQNAAVLALLLGILLLPVVHVTVRALDERIL